MPLLYRQSDKIPLASSRGETTEITGTRINGRGSERFLLLHGNPGSMLDFTDLAARLLDLGDVAAYDAPGFGLSASPSRDSWYLLDSFADVALQLLDHLGWQRAIIVGHSHGGGVAQRLATRWPERVKALVLLAPLGTPAHATYRTFPRTGVRPVVERAGRLLPRLPRFIRRPLVRVVMDRTYAPSHASARDLDNELALLTANPLVLRNMSLVTRGNPCDLLARDAPRIEAPTLFLHGTADPVVPIDHARHIHERLSQHATPNKFVPVDGAGHMVQVEAVDRCDQEIRGLLEKIS